MRHKRVRISDVAAEAGVSPTTTSFVLNGRDAAIPDTTRQRVLDAAQRMGYRPNASARALATGRTRRIGVALNTSYSLVGRGAYHTQLLVGIMSSLPQLDYNLLLHSASYARWQDLYDDILSGVADGVLLIGRESPDPLTAGLLTDGFPTVCVSYHINHPDCCSVDCDNEAGAFAAIRHLLKRGHENILVLTDGACDSWIRERSAGARRAVREAGLPPESLQFWNEPDAGLTQEEWTRRMADRLRASHPRLTAVFGFDEGSTRTLAECLPDVGIRVPDDISIVSFNSTEISERTRPPMTSVWQPLEDIGATAAQMLIQRIEKREGLPQIVRLPTRLDIRAT